MDLDIEMDVDDVHDVQDVPQIPEAYTHDIITGEEQEPGEIDDDDATNDANGNGDNAQTADKTFVPTKVHIRGLDTFNPEEVKAYVAEHCGLTQFDRVEWIDDTNANLVFRSEALAQEVLVALASVAIADPSALPPLEEVPAKGFSGKPDSVLFVRFAVQGDRKVVGAAARSRFYLLHPEYDPEERKRRGEFRDNRRYRDRNDGPRGRSNYRNDRNDRRREREEEEGEPFDVNLYDDDSTALGKRVTRPGSTRDTRSRSRRGSISSDVSTESNRLRSYARRNREKELFPDRRRSRSPRGRNRSASPLRDRDSDVRMDMDTERDNRYRDAASLRSREKGRAIKERLARTESGDRSTGDNSTKELFPSKANKPKELFPTKVSSTIGGRAMMDQVEEDVGKLASAKLADRITTRTTTTTPTTSSAGGFSIRGLATKNISSSTDQGFRIKGTGTTSTTVKELFPEKFKATGNNAGKELFAEKLEGRGQRRRRAEDMFY